jgi:Flp pilus assembly protein TadB
MVLISFISHSEIVGIQTQAHLLDTSPAILRGTEGGNMRKHDMFFIMSAVFLGITILCQTYSIIIARFEFVLLGIFSAFISWLFMLRAKKAITREFQELEEVLGNEREENTERTAENEDN